MPPALSQPSWEGCGRGAARRDQPHPLISLVSGARRTNFTRPKAPKKCRSKTAIFPLPRTTWPLLSWGQHLVKAGRARLTGNARPISPTDTKAGEMVSLAFVFSGFRLSCLAPEYTHRSAASPAETQHSFWPVRWKSLASHRARVAGDQRAGFHFGPDDIYREKKRMNKGFRSVDIHLTRQSWPSVDAASLDVGLIVRLGNEEHSFPVWTGIVREERRGVSGLGQSESKAASGLAP